jgi:3-phosphoshikimate 1-carboxyvinyltransferase
VELDVRGGCPGLKGDVKVPSDKSISHRAAIIAAVSGGACSIKDYSPAADCESTLSCLDALHVTVVRQGSELLVDGRGLRGFFPPAVPLDAGNSGTTMRLLAGALAAFDLSITITGDESLLSRPMARIAEPLAMMGADVELAERGRPPIMLRGGRLKGLEYRPPVASAQVKSAVLLAGLGAAGHTTVIERAATRDHTERILVLAGIEVMRDGLAVTVNPGVPATFDISIPGDFSSAAFLMSGALLVKGSDVTIRGVGLNPTRTGFLDLLDRMGADFEIALDEEGYEPVGLMRVRGSELESIIVDARDVALAIDEIPLLALLATQAQGVTSISGAGELRTKESDRPDATAKTLRAMGADVEEGEDWLTIEGPVRLTGAAVSSGGDHRIAMMAAIAGLVADGTTTIEGWEWTDVSFPGFAGVLKSLGGEVG